MSKSNLKKRDDVETRKFVTNCYITKTSKSHLLPIGKSSKLSTYNILTHTS